MSSEKLFAQTISAYAKPVQKRLAEIRKLILDTAHNTDGVGEIAEELRWSQFSFLTLETGSGSTIRIDGRKHEPDRLAIYFHCQSGLVADFKARYPKTFSFEGERALVFDARKPLLHAELSHCIALALTHHLRKRMGKKETRLA